MSASGDPRNLSACARSLPERTQKVALSHKAIASALRHVASLSLVRRDTFYDLREHRLPVSTGESGAEACALGPATCLFFQIAGRKGVGAGSTGRAVLEARTSSSGITKLALDVCFPKSMF